MKFDWIPNVFFDLLGRVAPGALVLLTATAIVVGPAPLLDVVKSGAIQKSLSGLLPTCAVILLSYFVGVCLSEIWNHTIARLYKNRARRRRANIRTRRLDEHLRLEKLIDGDAVLATKEEDLPDIFVMYDHLREEGSANATRLLKLRSEERFYDVVSCGLSILLPVDIFYLFVDYRDDRLILLILMIAAIILSYFKGRRSLEYFVGGTCSTWLLLSTRLRTENKQPDEYEHTSA